MLETGDNIELKDSDLYSAGRVIAFSNGDKILQRDLIEYKPTQPDKYHTVIQGDRLTALAYKYYSSVTETPSRYWKFIADANNILNPLDISEYIGRNIIIPDFNLIRLSE